MAQAKVVYPEKVMPFIAPGSEGVYASRMLIDKYNCGSEKIQVNHGVVAKGKALAGAVHEGHDEVYIVLKGAGKLNLGGEMYDIRPGTVVFIPGGTFHAIHNEQGEEDLEIITVWAGIPAEGVNEMYDLRRKAWGTTYREIEDQPE